MKIAGIAVLFAIAASSAFAGPAENFAKWDLNKDNILQKDEFVAMWKSWNKEDDVIEKAFAGKDKDQDGALTLEEFMPKAAQPAAAE